MSIEKYHIGFACANVIVLLLAVSIMAAGDYGDDQVLKFYCTQTEAISQRSNALSNYVQVVATAHTFYKRIASDGHVTSVDTAVIRYWFTGGIIDSQVVVSGNLDEIPQAKFDIPDVFSQDYMYSFFPNDPGGGMLSIGFDTPNDSVDLPVGLAVIDRDEYKLRRLYLHYPQLDGYKHLSRGFRLTECGEYLFPDSIWEVGSREGVLSTEHYRLESRIDSIIINK